MQPTAAGRKFALPLNPRAVASSLSSRHRRRLKPPPETTKPVENRLELNYIHVLPARFNGL